MKLEISEKQLKLILSNQVESELDEQEAAVDPQPAAGTSSTQSGGQGYPEVGKWESGVTRGPGNQVGVTKWSDVVGSTLQRGKGNPLKEQEIGLQPGRVTQIAQGLQAPEIERKNKIKQNFNKNYFTVKTPNSPSMVEGGTDLILPRVSLDGTPISYSLYKHPLDPNKFFKSWVGTEFNSFIPPQRDLQFILPNGTLKSFTINGVTYVSHVKRVSDNPLRYEFLWYYDKDMNPYYPNDFINQDEIPKDIQYDGSWWGKWGQWALMGGSILAATFIPGAQGLWISIGLDLVAAADLSIREKDNVGAGISVALAFVPVIGQELLGIGKAVGAGRFSKTSMNPKVIKRLAKEFAPLKTEKEVVNKINTLPPSEKLLVRTLLNEDPNTIGKLIEREIYRVSMKRIVNLEQSKKWVAHLNNLIKSGKIDKSGITWWYQTLGLKRLGWDLGVSGIIVLGGTAVKQLKDFEDADKRQKGLKDLIAKGKAAREKREKQEKK